MRKFVHDSGTKTCPLDPLPTILLNKCLGLLLPIITSIVNLSLKFGSMPADLKEALLTPLIKKLFMDSEILKNFRPISNLAFVSKLIEKCAISQVIDFAVKHCLLEPLQSAYKIYHSTETALLKAGIALFCSVRFDGRGAEPDCVATCHLCRPTMLPYLTLVSVHHQI